MSTNPELTRQMEEATHRAQEAGHAAAHVAQEKETENPVAAIGHRIQEGTEYALHKTVEVAQRANDYIANKAYQSNNQGAEATTTSSGSTSLSVEQERQAREKFDNERAKPLLEAQKNTKLNQ
jgi:hypothetical protein